MRAIRYGGVALLVCAAFVAGRAMQGRPAVQPSGGARILYYHDPMHPAYRSEGPGIAPDCGMQLEPVYAEESGSPGPRSTRHASGAVHVSAEKQQLIGVRTGAVQRQTATEHVRTVGRVVADERRIYRINAASEGWIRNIHSNSLGSLVAEDEPLASFYATPVLTAQQSFFYALDALDRFTASGAGESQMVATRAQVQQARDGLERLGMSRVQIDELARVRQAAKEVVVRSPVTGFVLVRNVSPGQRFEAGDELYVVADLRHVWVLADMFQYEVNYIRAGTTARVTLPHQGRSFKGRVSEVLPRFDPTSRTLKVRLELDNPAYVLRPDMFVDVEFPISLPPALTVPSDAVVDSGLRHTVFVDAGDGYFEPRRIETGWRFGDRVEVVSGLMEGERVVTSGTFLIDSESRLKASAAGARGETVKDVTCGMDVDEARARAAGLVSTRDGRTYAFCSADCKARFDRDRRTE